MHDNDYVDAEFRCPRCGENRADNLVCQDDDSVRCASCGHVYDPIESSKGNRT